MDARAKPLALDLMLLSVLEGSERYGLEMIDQVNARTGGAFDFREGSLYPALHRLVKQGWVETRWRDSSCGGAPRKYYSLTPAGERALAAKKNEWGLLRSAMDRLLEGAP
ncbi:PadR family transcriptional regulator PadR [Deinobacterium chartae]|uniref:PadR family transcriptional regulator PadR n=1 Tax=Deinobacterium chartae TaxID=521158 RepID=A0A841I2S3_9DEIO|nr:PadR family transcriptional regulator [Deinobacterium chartae]MBB6098710.1 PadR family transcriptional regulator PadR [Deinobacterium chartae]